MKGNANREFFHAHLEIPIFFLLHLFRKAFFIPLDRAKREKPGCLSPDGAV